MGASPVIKCCSCECEHEQQFDSDGVMDHQAILDRLAMYHLPAVNMEKPKPTSDVLLHLVKKQDADCSTTIEESDIAYTVYLPKTFCGDEVLVEEEKKGRWRAVKQNPDVNTAGLNYRATKDFDDLLAGETELAWGDSFKLAWGEVVDGVDEGDGWVRCDIRKGRATVELKKMPSRDGPLILENVSQHSKVEVVSSHGENTSRLQETSEGGHCQQKESNAACDQLQEDTSELPVPTRQSAGQFLRSMQADVSESPSASSIAKPQSKSPRSKAKAASKRAAAAAAQPQKTDIASANAPIVYDGKFEHPVFGRRKIDITVTLIDDISGTWVVLGKTKSLRVTWHGERVIIDDGMTQFVGCRDLKGNIKGEVCQEAERGGSFSLKKRRVVENDGKNNTKSSL